MNKIFDFGAEEGKVKRYASVNSLRLDLPETGVIHASDLSGLPQLKELMLGPNLALRAYLHDKRAYRVASLRRLLLECNDERPDWEFQACCESTARAFSKRKRRIDIDVRTRTDRAFEDIRLHFPTARRITDRSILDEEEHCAMQRQVGKRS